MQIAVECMRPFSESPTFTVSFTTATKGRHSYALTVRNSIIIYQFLSHSSFSPIVLLSFSPSLDPESWIVDREGWDFICRWETYSVLSYLRIILILLHCITHIVFSFIFIFILPPLYLFIHLYLIFISPFLPARKPLSIYLYFTWFYFILLLSYLFFSYLIYLILSYLILSYLYLHHL